MKKREEFFNRLFEIVKQHVDSDYILLGVPKHMNLGDSLIWQAEKEMLEKVPYKNKGTYFCYTDLSKIRVSEDDVIIFSGGGSWNDIWETLSYIENIITTFNKNKIFFMPNSIWYNNHDRIKRTQQAIDKHKSEIVLCCRDKQGYDIATKNFQSINVYLTADVVLTWDINSYMERHGIKNIVGDGKLFIHRNDRELKKTDNNISCDKTSDWPTVSKYPSWANKNFTCKEWENNVLDKLIQCAINFILPYNIVYSDRMHGAILAWLLGKQVVLIDNTYGKSKSLYETWLNNDEKIKLNEPKKTNILIIHYNTPYLTECLIKSINKFVGKNCNIYIFDNSTSAPFTYKQENLILLDNTDGKLADLSFIPDKCVSAKHCYSVEKCLDIIQDSFVLLDSDVLLKRNISCFVDEKYVCISEVNKHYSAPEHVYYKTRFTPFICFINSKIMREKGLHYFNESKMISIDGTKNYYDTGASFYEDVINNKLPYKNIKFSDYIVHYGDGSWKRNDENSIKQWLTKYKNLYTNEQNQRQTTKTNNSVAIHRNVTNINNRISIARRYRESNRNINWG